MIRIFFLLMISIVFFNCKKEVELNGESNTQNIIKSNVLRINDSIPNLPTGLDSINIRFDINKYENFILHINSSNYVLKDLNNLKSYNVNILKDSLDKYVNNLFIYETVKPIIGISKSDYIRSEPYSSMTIIKYFDSKQTVVNEILIKDENIEVKFSKEYLQFRNLLFFISKSPSDIEKRLNVLERFKNNR